MSSLAEWDTAAHRIDAIYREDLLRSGGEITIGEMANWLFHWRENGQSLDWIRDRIRESPEYQQKHGGSSPPVSPPPVPERPPSPGPAAPTPVAPLPAAGGGRVIKVTDASDGELVNRGYSYWPQACYIRDMVVLFAGHIDGNPRFWGVDPDGTVHRLGSLLRSHYSGTGEGIYFDASGWLFFCEGPRLRHVNPFTSANDVVFSIEDTHPGCRIFQTHSADNGQAHSATVQRIVNDGPYPNIGTVVFRRGAQEYFPALGTLDESQITPDGRWLIIKENDDNRIIDLDTRITQTIRDADGAVGHSDCGPGILVGEDDQHGACVLWDLAKPRTPGNRRELLKTWELGHVSVRGGRCLRASKDALSLIAQDGSGETILGPHGMTSDGTYDTQVFASLDPSGRVAAYLSNKEGRMDLYLAIL